MSAPKAKVKPNPHTKPGPAGSTTGIVAPKTEPGPPGGNARPAVIAETPQEEGFLQKTKGATQQEIDDWVAAKGNSKLAMAAGALGTALNEVFMPEALWELIPVGKALKIGKKGAEAVGVIKTGEEATEQLVKKAQGKGGGHIKGKPHTTAKAKCGEWLARQDMMQEGFDQVVQVQNNSNHGIDLIGRNSQTGEVKVWEVKTTEGTSAPSLSKQQASMGGPKYTVDRLGKAASGYKNYGKVPEAMANAEKALDWLDKAEDKVSYQKREVFIDDITEGCAKHPGRPSRSKPWTGKP